MKVHAQRRQYGLRFGITPLIDVVFLLIIFFLVASHFIRNERVEAVQLPETRNRPESTEESAHRLVVTITADQTLHVSGKAVPLAEVETLIAAGQADAKGPRRGTFEVQIRCDRTVPFRVVEPLLLACARNRVSSVKYSVISKQR